MNVSVPYRRPAGGWAWREHQLARPTVPQQLRIPLATAAAVLAVAFIITVVHSLFFATRPVRVTVDSLTWARGWEVQQWRTVEHDDWQVPPGGRELDAYQAVHHYERVLSYYRPVSYSCGTSQAPRMCTRMDPVYRDEPVYRTKYRYEIDEWTHDRWERLAGDHRNRPNWSMRPETYREPKPPKLGDYRFNPDLSAREEAYAVMVATDDGMRFPKEVDLAVWDRLAVGGELTGHMTRRGVLRSVDW